MPVPVKRGKVVQPSAKDRADARMRARAAAMEATEMDTAETVDDDVAAVDADESQVGLFDLGDISKEVQRLSKLTAFEPDGHYWLRTPHPYLNKALGSEERGLAYGKIYELAGPEHGGKTLVSTIVMGLAQSIDGAPAIYVDPEESRDEDWAGRLGVDWRGVIPIYPKLIKARPPKKKQKKQGAELTAEDLEEQQEAQEAKVTLAIESAEMLFEEAEQTIKLLAGRGFKRQFMMLDSIANLLPQEVIDAGFTAQNMRTHSARAAMLSHALPRLAALAANYNVMVFLINQLREKVGMVFGDPTYSPGGRALRHACAIRAGIARVQNGRLLQNGKTVGIRGCILNKKNKSGAGSVEGGMCQFAVRWDKPKAVIRFTEYVKKEKER